MANAPMQLRKRIHIGSFMDIVFMNLLKKHCYKDSNIVIEWNAIGIFREKDDTVSDDKLHSLYTTMTQLADDCVLKEFSAMHYIDDSRDVHDACIEIVNGLLSVGSLSIRTYNALYCSQCDSYIAPASHTLQICGRCSSPLSIKETTDLFAFINKESVKRCANMSHFNPGHAKYKFINSLNSMPSCYAVTKSRKYGISALSFDARLTGKVLDPKFVFSLFPAIIKTMGMGVLDTLVIGDDVLNRLLFNVFASSTLLTPVSLNVFVHGMLMSAGKKISKRDNLPEIRDVRVFCQQWSWDHLSLLCITSEFGKNIDFDSRIIDVHRLIRKRENALMFLHKILPNMQRQESFTDIEREIINCCDQLDLLLASFRVHNFYREYRDLWFSLISRRYISSLKKDSGSKDGLLTVIKKIESLI